MVDRASSGRPVLSGPADLGLKDNDGERPKVGQELGESTQKGQSLPVTSGVDL